MADNIISTLLEWNPWFENTIPTHLTGIPRDYELTTYTRTPEIKILEGVRRSGKSTLLYQVAHYGIKQGKNVLYINFDDELLKQYDLSHIYYAFLQRSSIDYLLIDEIQQCPNWVPFIRKMYDKKSIEQIWITGSNASLIKKEYAELLTGRNLKLTTSPLSFAEYLRFKGFNDITLPVSPTFIAQIKIQLTNYINFGAFPAIALREVFQRELLINYFEDFLYKDIASRYDINTTKLKDLAIYLTTHSTKLLSYRKTAHMLSLHANTVNDYITYMKDVFLFNEIYKFDFSLKKQHGHNKKLYMIDTGLMNAMAFRFSEDKGCLLEALVYQHLRRFYSEIYFHQGKKECDFIIKQGLTITHVIQVTHSLNDPTTKERELAGLTDALHSYEEAIGLIITLDESDTLTLNIDGKKHCITVKSLWEWLLSPQSS